MCAESRMEQRAIAPRSLKRFLSRSFTPIHRMKGREQ